MTLKNKTKIFQPDPSSKQARTHFGFQQVTYEEKTQKVKEVFDSVATKYDRMNDLMSLTIHRFWKNELIRELSPFPGMHLLDMAGGTGDIALRFLKKTEFMVPCCHVTVCDFNQEMLEVGRSKAVNQGILERITYVQADATIVNFASNSFDAYTIAFGLRNVSDIEKALQAAYCVLKPGARFLCLEFSKIKSPWLNSIYKQYAFKVIPRIGQMVAKDSQSYQYLVESIEKFPPQEELSKMLKDVGFKYVTYRNLSNGIVAIHSGIKTTDG